MKRISLGVVYLFFFTFSLAQAETIDAQKNGYTLYRSDILKVIDYSSMLAGRDLPGNDQWSIYHFWVAFFKQDPVKALESTKALNKFVERVDSSKSDFEYQLAVQSIYHKAHYEWTYWSIGGYKSIDTIYKKHNPVFEMDKDSKFFVQYNDSYRVKKNGQYLNNFMLDTMVKIAEFLAQSELSSSDKTKVKRWAIEDFKAHPANSTKDYAYFINVLLPQIYRTALPKGTYSKSASDLSAERERLYTWFYFYGAKRNSLNIDYDIMDIVEKYNPVLVKDTQNKVLVPESSLNASLSQYQFLEKIIGIPVQVTKEIYFSHKNSMIKSFVKRRYTDKYTSTSRYVIQLQEVWANYSSQEKANLARQMKQLYLASASMDSIYDPLYVQISLNIYNSYLYSVSLLNLTNQVILQTARRVDNIIDDFSRFNHRQSLQISGATILGESNNYFVVEYPERPGETYYVHM